MRPTGRKAIMGDGAGRTEMLVNVGGDDFLGARWLRGEMTTLGAAVIIHNSLVILVGVVLVAFGVLVILFSGKK